MVMKKTVLFLVVTQVLVSCITRETESIAETVIVNDSYHTVNYIVYGNHGVHGIDVLNIKLLNGGKHKEIRGDIGGVDPFPFLSDSVQITFNSKKTITYYYELNPINKRNPFSEQTYNIKDLGDYHYEYTYTITE